MAKKAKYIECHISLSMGDAVVTRDRGNRQMLGLFERQSTLCDEIVSPIGEAIDSFIWSIPKTSGTPYVGDEQGDLVDWLTRAKEYEGWVTIYRDASVSPIKRGAYIIYAGPSGRSTARMFDIPDDRVLRAFANVIEVYLSGYEYEAKLLRDYAPIEYACAMWETSETAFMRKIATGNKLVRSVKIGGMHLFDVVGLSKIGPWLPRSWRWRSHGAVQIDKIMSRGEVAKEFNVLPENVRRLVDSGVVTMVPVTSVRALYYKTEDART